jgi:L,D-peptidoglycan transpeptidase YkuD (ErfK/YbiS/YcfS/YnhG family)
VVKKIAVFFVVLSLAFIAGGLVSYSVKEKGEFDKAVWLAVNNSVNDSIRQLLVVFNDKPADSIAVLVALERKNNHWRKVYGPIRAGIGRKGFASPGEKREGDKKSPTGFFRLGRVFCYESDIKTSMPWQQSTPDDKWIDDPGSPDYNRYVKGATTASSFEKLRIKTNDYRYCMVIEYNTNPVLKGMGSAIFLHLGEGEDINPSAGCVVIRQKEMEILLKWMKPEKNPSILMGNEKGLAEGK